jgi:presenilin-like A22 family membrane protease
MVPTTDAVYGVGIFFYILLATGFVLLVIKYWKNFLKVMEVVSILVSSWVFFQVLILGFVPYGAEVVPALVLAIAVTLSRLVWKNLLTQNIAMLLSIIGVGALIGASLGFLPALILLGLLTVYDVIAVFKTKHMVTMAQEITKQQLAFTLAIPTPKHVFQLGGGDLVMPLVFSIAVLREFGPVVAIATVLGSMITLTVFFAWLFNRPGKAYPALPPVTLGAILGWSLAVIIGVLF